jgi:4-hydroxyphenylpyruvate dioxygenase
LVAAMREFGVLYDGDEHGDFLHFYMPLAGARLFFEVVHRNGGYDGYGAPNSAGRMAAHQTRLEALAVA